MNIIKRISTINYYGQVCFLLLLLAFCNMLHAQTPYYKIGDHYTDELGQQGIIASISNDNRTGWMVALQDVPSSRNWSRITNIPVPNMNVIPTPASNVYEWGIYIPVTADRDGYDNTAKMRAAGSSEEFAAAYYVDYENGWYIPSVGQMRVVAISQPLLGISLYEDTYWTSTQNSAANAWAINIEDYSYEVIEKIYAHRIRPVKNINFERQIILEVNDPIMGSATSDCDVCVNDTCSCLYGATVVLTATANEGYHFTQWQDGNTQNLRTLTFTNDATYTAFFAINNYILTVNSDNAAMGTAAGGGTFDFGTTATLTATPAVGYHFTQWQDGNTQNPHTVIVTEAALYTASFDINSYTISAYSNDVTMGSVTGGGTYDYGTTATLTATSAVGHHFTQWQDGNTQNPHTVTVAGTATYTATFEINTYIVSVNSDNVAMGTAAGGGIFTHGAITTLTATPAVGHHFTQWQDGSTLNPHTVTVTATATYTANFEVNNYTLTVNSDDDNMGTATGGGTYNYGATAILTATPATEHHFVSWQDGNTHNPRTLIVTQTATYTASFEINSYTITVNSNDDDM
ncbi:MAG: hypothetical protein PHQ33_06685, partial [Bacteroidales bacterium]|nr:hypothetical protein [Bacteroidales bacterium]